MPKYGKSREHLKRIEKHLTQARAGGRRAAGVRELLWDVSEYVLPLLPARALLRARAVCRCGLAFTWDSVGRPHVVVGRLNYQRHSLVLHCCHPGRHLTVGCLTCHHHRTFVLHCCYHGRHLSEGCLTRYHHKPSYDCIFRSSPSLIGVWWNECCRLTCLYINNPRNN